MKIEEQRSIKAMIKILEITQKLHEELSNWIQSKIREYLNEMILADDDESRMQVWYNFENLLIATDIALGAVEEGWNEVDTNSIFRESFLQ